MQKKQEEKGDFCILPIALGLYINSINNVPVALMSFELTEDKFVNFIIPEEQLAQLPEKLERLYQELQKIKLSTN